MRVRGRNANETRRRQRSRRGIELMRLPTLSRLVSFSRRRGDAARDGPQFIARARPATALGDASLVAPCSSGDKLARASSRDRSRPSRTRRPRLASSRHGAVTRGNSRRRPRLPRAWTRFSRCTTSSKNSPCASNVVRSRRRVRRVAAAPRGGRASSSAPPVPLAPSRLVRLRENKSESIANDASILRRRETRGRDRRDRSRVPRLRAVVLLDRAPERDHRQRADFARSTTWASARTTSRTECCRLSPWTGSRARTSVSRAAPRCPRTA